jgi:hypothetical protein
MRARLMMLGVAPLLLAVGALGSACGGDEDDDGGTASPTVAVVSDGASADDLPDYETGDPNPAAGGESTSLVADLRLTFEGEEYRLADLQPEEAIDRSEMSALGEGASSDVEAADMTIYRRTGDDDGVWLFVEARGEGDQAVPSTWYRFAQGDFAPSGCAPEDQALC